MAAFICGRQMEALMTSELQQRLADLTTQLTEILMSAAILVDEIRAILQSDSDHSSSAHPNRSSHTPVRNTRHHRPFVENSTFSVFWQGKTCPLRNTINFRLAARLARQPNQYITAGQLLADVWDGGVKSPDTIRSTVRNLRSRFRQAGMSDLAAAIRGTGGRYGLILDPDE